LASSDDHIEEVVARARNGSRCSGNRRRRDGRTAIDKRADPILARHVANLSLISGPSGLGRIST
jgi:hypothetical protein